MVSKFFSNEQKNKLFIKSVSSLNQFFLRLNNYILVTTDVEYSKEYNLSLTLYLNNEKNYLYFYLNQNSQKIKSYFTKAITKYKLNRLLAYTGSVLSFGLIVVGGLGGIGLEVLNYFHGGITQTYKPLSYYLAFAAIGGFLLFSISANILIKSASTISKKEQEFRNIKEFIRLLDDNSKSLNIKEIENIKINF